MVAILLTFLLPIRQQILEGRDFKNAIRSKQSSFFSFLGGLNFGGATCQWLNYDVYSIRGSETMSEHCNEAATGWYSEYPASMLVV